MVDRLRAQEEVVIMSLGDFWADVPGVAGAMITGDGKVVLVLDMAEMVQKSGTMSMSAKAGERGTKSAAASASANSSISQSNTTRLISIRFANSRRTHVSDAKTKRLFELAYDGVYARFLAFCQQDPFPFREVPSVLRKARKSLLIV